MPDIRIRPAEPLDADAIHALVVALAVYEKEPDAVEGGAGDFAAALFSERPEVFCHVAEVSDDGRSWQVAGIAIWYVTFSTWKVRHGLWLEDLFVDPARRGLGLGPAAPAGARGDLSGTGLREVRVVGARLEHARSRVLPLSRCTPAGRVDRMAHRR